MSPSDYQEAGPHLMLMAFLQRIVNGGGSISGYLDRLGLDEGFSYKESGPHLMLMAFLQRIVNGGGRIDREYALGKGALDLLVTWKTQRIAIELKLWRRPTTEAKGLQQLAGYLDALALREGWLVIFRNDDTVDWDTRIFTRTETVGTRTLHVVGC